MSNDIRDIIERLAILEGRITPTTVKHGLNPQQKSVPQLPALFKPKHISVLQNKTDPEHPMHDYAVGASESTELDESHMSNIDQLMQDIGTGEVDIYDIYAHPSTPEEEYASKIVNRMYDDVVIDRGLHPDDQFEEILEIVADQIAHDYPVVDITEAVATEEKLLDKVKKSLTDYLTSIENKYKDADIKEKNKVDRDLGKKDRQDHDLLPRAKEEVEESIAMPECGALKVITLEDGRVCEIHGDKPTGFEIRFGNRRLPSKFKSLDQAELALEMFQARCHTAGRDDSADYIEEK